MYQQTCALFNVFDLGDLVGIGFRRMLLRLAAPIVLIVAFAVPALVSSGAAASTPMIGAPTVAPPIVANALNVVSPSFPEEEADLCIFCKSPRCSGHKTLLSSSRVSPSAIIAIEEPAPSPSVVPAPALWPPPRYPAFHRPAFDPRGPPALD